MIKLVIAGNYQQFKRAYPKPDRNIRYVSRREDLRGFSGAEIERIGTWWKLPTDFLAEVQIMQNRFEFETNRRASHERR